MPRLAPPVDDDAELEMTPMIDVTFLLLIFFMCTLKFKTLEERLETSLPKEAGQGVAESIQRVEVHVEVVSPGERLDAQAGAGRGFGPDRRLTWRVGPRRLTSLDALHRRLVELRRSSEDPRPVTIHPGPGVVHGEIVAVLDRCLDAGLDEVGFSPLREVARSR